MGAWRCAASKLPLACHTTRALHLALEATVDMLEALWGNRGGMSS
jgi:hypothetical protein